MATRKDPELRKVMSADDEGRVKNADPRMVYVLAYKGDDDTGLAHYLELGYEAVRYSDGGERLKVGVTGETGSFIEWKGHVLCRIEREVRDQMQRTGGEGWGMGSDYTDLVERKITGRGGIDGLRSDQKYYEIQNTTKRGESITA